MPQVQPGTAGLAGCSILRVLVSDGVSIFCSQTLLMLNYHFEKHLAHTCLVLFMNNLPISRYIKCAFYSVNLLLFLCIYCESNNDQAYYQLIVFISDATKIELSSEYLFVCFRFYFSSSSIENLLSVFL